ncbi:MAG: OsmC family protein [bacterium]
MTITVEWRPPKRFEGATESGARFVMDARVDAGGGGAGPSPMEAVLAALAGCTGIDVVGILEKMRAGLEGLVISVSAERATEHPRVFTKIHLRYTAWGKGLARDQVERAVTLSKEKYCSVSAMLSRTAAMTHEIVVTERAPSGESR